MLFRSGKDNWLAQCSTSDPSTSEVRDGNGKPRCSKKKSRNKDDSPKSTALNAAFKSSRSDQQKPPPKGNGEELSSQFWTKYAKSTAPPTNPPITPIENVGSSSSPANSMPNTRGRIHQAKTRTSLASKALGNRRNSHQKSKQ